MRKHKLFGTRLLAPDGAGAGTGAAGGAQGPAAGMAGDAARQGEAGAPAGAPGTKDGAAAEAVPAVGADRPVPDRGKQFAELVNGEYKAEAEKWFQNRFDRRHRDYKAMQERQEAMQPALAMVMQMFDWDGKDPKVLEEHLQRDNALWEAKALENGMSTDQYKQWVKMQAENRALTEALQQRRQAEQAAETKQRYEQQFEAVLTMYPGAAEQLRTDFENPQFLRMIEAGVDMLPAFQVLHQDEIMRGAVQFAARDAAGKVAQSVAANRRRPVENGSAPQAPASPRFDIGSMTKEERRALIERARNGERITLTEAP